MNKKLIKRQLITVAAAMAVLALTGCSGDNDTLVVEKTTASAENNSGNVTDDNHTGYYVIYNGVSVGIGDDMKQLSSSLGEADVTTSTSCKYAGEDNNYKYDGITFTAFIDTDSEKIYTITIDSDMVKTKEGVTIGDSVSNVIEAYGQPEEDGVYKYEKDGMTLIFTITNDSVSGIVYSEN